MKAKQAIDYLGTMASGLISPHERLGNIVMFHDGRSGSTVLGDLLNQQGEIFWDSEIFMPNRLNPLPSGLSRFMMRRPERLIQARRMRTDKAFYGFEMKFAQMQRIGYTFENYLKSLEGLGFHYFILLKRKNGLRRIVSNAVGQSKQTASFHLGQNEKVHLVQVELDIDNLSIGRETQPLLVHLATYEGQYDEALQIFGDRKVLQLVYEEDISQDPRQAYAKICRFLGLEPGETKIHYKKTNPFPLSEIITNYDEVCENLTGSPFEWMLYD